MHPSRSTPHRIPAPDKHKRRPLTASLFTLFVASCAAYSMSLKPAPAHSVSFEGLGIEGWRWDRGRISKPRVARQQCQTAEHDQHKERVIAAVTRLVRHITVFSEIHMRVYRTRTHTFSSGSERSASAALVMRTKFYTQDHQDGLTLMKLTFLPVYLLFPSDPGAFFIQLWPPIRHTSMRPLSAAQMPVFLCDIPPAAECSPPAGAVFSHTVLFGSVVSIHNRGLRGFNQTPLRICSDPKFQHNPMKLGNQSCLLPRWSENAAKNDKKTGSHQTTVLLLQRSGSDFKKF